MAHKFVPHLSNLMDSGALRAIDQQAKCSSRCTNTDLNAFRIVFDRTNDRPYFVKAKGVEKN